MCFFSGNRQVVVVICNRTVDGFNFNDGKTKYVCERNNSCLLLTDKQSTLKYHTCEIPNWKNSTPVLDRQHKFKICFICDEIVPAYKTVCTGEDHATI